MSREVTKEVTKRGLSIVRNLDEEEIAQVISVLMQEGSEFTNSFRLTTKALGYSWDSPKSP